MGVEIRKSKFTSEEESEFQKRLRDETKLLMKLFSEGAFVEEGDRFGLELEAWLLDPGFLPSPSNAALLRAVNSSDVTTELSQYCFELNTPAQGLAPDLFSRMERGLLRVWSRCVEEAEKLGLHALLIGIPPTLRDEMLRPSYMTRKNRYFAMNERLLELHGGEPFRARLEGGRDGPLELTHPDVMLEAANTSAQYHIQLRRSEAKRFLNASMIAAAPVVAVAANSPFLFGRELWEETRIPLFEQGIFTESYRDAGGNAIGRVSFGSSYCRESLLELFLENLTHHPVLLPAVQDSRPEELRHVQLQNGTIWRWNRPVIGISERGEYHLRVEHRVAAAGPTPADAVANAAFYIGLAYHLSRTRCPPEELLTFEDARQNFYEAARRGLAAEVTWLGGRKVGLGRLVREELVPAAARALAAIGVDASELDHYLRGIVGERVTSGQTGAAFQRGFVAKHGRDFIRLTEAYFAEMSRNQPVHRWRL